MLHEVRPLQVLELHHVFQIVEGFARSDARHVENVDTREQLRCCQTGYCNTRAVNVFEELEENCAIILTNYAHHLHVVCVHTGLMLF